MLSKTPKLYFHFNGNMAWQDKVAQIPSKVKVNTEYYLNLFVVF